MDGHRPSMTSEPVTPSIKVRFLGNSIYLKFLTKIRCLLASSKGVRFTSTGDNQIQRLSPIGLDASHLLLFRNAAGWVSWNEILYIPFSRFAAEKMMDSRCRHGRKSWCLRWRWGSEEGGRWEARVISMLVAGRTYFCQEKQLSSLWR